MISVLRRYSGNGAIFHAVTKFCHCGTAGISVIGARLDSTPVCSAMEHIHANGKRKITQRIILMRMLMSFPIFCLFLYIHLTPEMQPCGSVLNCSECVTISCREYTCCSASGIVCGVSQSCAQGAHLLFRIWNRLRGFTVLPAGSAHVSLYTDLSSPAVY